MTHPLDAEQVVAVACGEIAAAVELECDVFFGGGEGGGHVGGWEKGGKKGGEGGLGDWLGGLVWSGSTAFGVLDREGCLMV